MKKLNMAIIGCGNRCRMYKWVFEAMDDIDVIMLYDADIERARSHLENYPKACIADSLQEVLGDPEIDAVIIATPDGTHCDIATQAINAGKHVLVEKPLSLNIENGMKLQALCEKSDLVLQLAFTLRATPFYNTIYKLVRDGMVGQIIGIEAAEHMGRDHGASYMRRWQRKTELSGGLLMNKCCHDIDLLYWLAGSPAKRVASFGGRDFFNPGKHTATHCSKCDEVNDCRFRFTGSHVSMTEEMKANPTKYDLDLCVFTSDKDIVDNQVVVMEYENNVRATFTVQMFSDRSDRTIHISGSKGFIRGSFNSNTITIYVDGEGMKEHQIDKLALGSHGGGDAFLVRNFADSIRKSQEPLSSCCDGVENTVTCIAADIARTEGRVMDMETMKKQE